MSSPKLPAQFLPPFTFQYGMVFCGTLKKDNTIALNVRGTGYLTGTGSGALGLDHDTAADIQEKFAAWVAEALNRRAAEQVDELTDAQRFALAHATLVDLQKKGYTLCQHRVFLSPERQDDGSFLADDMIEIEASELCMMSRDDDRPSLFA